MSSDWFFLLALVLPGILVAEVVLSANWSRWYFASGVTLYRSRIGLSEAGNVPSLEELNDFGTSEFGPNLIFRAIGDDEIGFREEMLNFSLFHYTPMMHGVIRVDRSTLAVDVVGKSNWFGLAFAVFLLGFFIVMERGTLGFFLPALGILGLLYGIQAARYRRLTSLIRKRAGERVL